MRIVLASALGVSVCWAASLVATAGGWPLAPGVLRIAAADALLIEAAWLIVAAPLAGVVLARAKDARDAGRTRFVSHVRRLAVPVVVFTLVSCAAALAAASASGLTMTLVVRSHVTLAAVAFGLTALGAFFSALCTDVLDAAGSAVCVSVLLSAVVLVGGPATANWPQALVDGGLLASPPIAVASAAGIDLLRSEVWYQVSPISHRRFTYPAWNTAAAAYVAAAAVLMLGTLRKASST